MHAATDLEQRSARAPGTAKSCRHYLGVRSVQPKFFKTRRHQHQSHSGAPNGWQKRGATAREHMGVDRRSIVQKNSANRFYGHAADALQVGERLRHSVAQKFFAKRSARLARRRILCAVAERRWHHACQTSRIFSLVLVGALSSCREAPSSKEK